MVSSRSQRDREIVPFKFVQLIVQGLIKTENKNRTEMASDLQSKRFLSYIPRNLRTMSQKFFGAPNFLLRPSENHASLSITPRGYFHIERSEALGLWNSCWSPKFCLHKYRWQIPQILPPEFQIWPQNWDFSQLLRLAVTELPKLFLLFSEIGRILPEILPPNLLWGPSSPPPPPPRPLNMAVSPLEA